MLGSSRRPSRQQQFNYTAARFNGRISQGHHNEWSANGGTSACADFAMQDSGKTISAHGGIF